MALRVVLGACMFLMLSTVFCLADSLIITYQSGNTQIIPLDDSTQSITSLKYVSNVQSNNNSKNIPTNKSTFDEAVPIESYPKLNSKSSSEPDTKVKFKWAKPVGSQ